MLSSMVCIRVGVISDVGQPVINTFTRPALCTQVSPHRPAHHTHPLPFSWLKGWLACVPDPFPASPWTGRARSLRWRMMRVLLWRGAVVLKAQASDRWRHLRRRRPKPRRSSAPQPCAVNIVCLVPMLSPLLCHLSWWRSTCGTVEDVRSMEVAAMSFCKQS